MLEGSQVPTVYVKYNDLVGKYRTEKLRALRTNFFKELNATEGIEIMNWIRDFESMGVKGLKIKEGRGRKSIVNPDEEKVIRKWLARPQPVI